MYHCFQSDIRENSASNRRHGSRPASRDLLDATLTEDATTTSPPRPVGQNHSLPEADRKPDAASPRAATGKEKKGQNETQAVAVALMRSQNPTLGFEPLIGSPQAAKLLGNIHVKTLQRYARQRRIPGYQIGGHWYFRASELDSWLQSRINLSCHPCRLNQEESDGT